MIQNNNEIPGLNNKFLNRLFCYIIRLLGPCNLIGLTSEQFLDTKMEKEHKRYVIYSSTSWYFSIPIPSSFSSSHHVYTWIVQSSVIPLSSIDTLSRVISFHLIVLYINQLSLYSPCVQFLTQYDFFGTLSFNF